MSIVHSSVVDAPIDDIYQWFNRPGAFTRLAPPWQPTGLAARWRDIPDLRDVGANQTRVTDRFDTWLGSRVLRPMFVYRHRQLADDLAAHRWATEIGTTPSTIAITGASGLVGSQLSAFLTSGGHRVIRLVRRAPRGVDERSWDPRNPAPSLLNEVDAVVHLAGTSITGRFTAAHKRAIRNSRIKPTRLLAEKAADAGVNAFVSASAIGFYGSDRGDELLRESSEHGEGFLAEVVVDWEAATAPAADAGIRVANIRTGIVQSPRGGTLRLFRPLFSAGVGGPLAGGQQWTSWIDIDDLVDVYHRALFDTRLSGPVNAVAPHPVRNDEYARTLARVLRRAAPFPVPSLGPKMVLGSEGSAELAEASQKVSPDVLVSIGHAFRRSDLESSLRHQLGRNRKP